MSVQPALRLGASERISGSECEFSLGFFLLGSSPAFLLICLRGIGRDWNALAGETNEVAHESTQTLGGARSHLILLKSWGFLWSCISGKKQNKTVTHFVKKHSRSKSFGTL